MKFRVTGEENAVRSAKEKAMEAGKIKWTETDKVLVVTTSQEVATVTPDDLRKIYVQRTYDGYKSLLTDVTVDTVAYGLFDIGGQIYPSYDLSVVEYRGKECVIPRAADYEVVPLPITECKATTLPSLSGVGAQMSASEFFAVCGHNNVTHAVHVRTGVVYDLSRAVVYVISQYNGNKEVPSCYAYVLMIDGKILPVQMAELEFVNGSATGGIEEEYRTFNFNFNEPGLDDDLYFLKTELMKREFKVPASRISALRTWQSQIANGTISRSQLMKMADIIKLRIGMVVLDTINADTPEIFIRVPRENRENSAVYNNVEGLTNDILSKLTKGIKIPATVYDIAGITQRASSNELTVDDMRTLVSFVK